MYCTNCGSKLEENVVICPNCGIKKTLSQNVDSNKLVTSNKKVKLKWWIPVLIFVAGFLLNMMALIVSLASVGNENSDEIVNTTSNIYEVISSCLSTLSIIAWLLVIPSVIFVIVIYEKQRSKTK